MGLPWAPMDFHESPMGFHGSFVISHWYTVGVLGFPWISYRSPTGSSWIAHGLQGSLVGFHSIVFLWFSHGCPIRDRGSIVGPR